MPDSQLSIVATVVAAVATPATLALSAYHVTGNPNLRPLAVAVATVSERVPADPSTIHVSIRWPGDPRSADVAAFASHIHDSLYAFGQPPHITARAIPRDAAGSITFRTGPNSFGPFPLDQAALGVRPVVAAWHMAHPEGTD